MAKKSSTLPVWFDILSTLASADSLPRRILLTGPPGTGKSRWADRIGPVERITLHGGIDPADLIGSWHLRCASPGAPAETIWGDGPAVRALRLGVPLVLDEIDQAGPDVECALCALLDDPPGITLASGERLSAGDGYRVIATTNAAPGNLPERLLERFELVLLAALPTPEALSRLPQAHREVLSSHYARQTAVSWERPLSLRTMLAFSALENALGRELAARITFGATGDALVQSIAVAETAPEVSPS